MSLPSPTSPATFFHRYPRNVSDPLGQFEGSGPGPPFEHLQVVSCQEISREMLQKNKPAEGKVGSKKKKNKMLRFSPAWDPRPGHMGGGGEGGGGDEFIRPHRCFSRALSKSIRKAGVQMKMYAWVFTRAETWKWSKVEH